MTLSMQTLRPGFLVSLKTSLRGGVQYDRRVIESKAALTNGEVKSWETDRFIQDPVEFEKAKKARNKAANTIRKVCAISAFGLLCPEVDAERLEKAIADARAICEAFNAEAQLTRISVFALTGRVMPDDVEAVKAISSEIRELMSEMSGGIENGNVTAIREAAAKVKGLGEMLATEAQTKVEMAVKTAREAAKVIVKEQERVGPNGAVSVDKSAINRITMLRAAFLDLDEGDDQPVAAKTAKAAQLDLDSATWEASNSDLRAAEQGEPR